MNEKPKIGLFEMLVLIVVTPQVLLAFATIGTAVLDKPSPVSRLTSQTTEKSVKWTQNELKQAPRKIKRKRNAKVYSK